MCQVRVGHFIWRRKSNLVGVVFERVDVEIYLKSSRSSAEMRVNCMGAPYETLNTVLGLTNRLGLGLGLGFSA